MKSMFQRDANGEGNLVSVAEEAMRKIEGLSHDETRGEEIQRVFEELSPMMIMLRKSAQVARGDYERLNARYLQLRKDYQERGMLPFLFLESGDAMQEIMDYLREGVIES